MRTKIMVFAKTPREGLVKTRLIPRVGARLACQLHEAFVEDTLECLTTVQTSCQIELHTDVLWEGHNSELQVGEDLGERMLNALREALADGCDLAMIVGSDAPTLPSGHVDAMLGAGADVCLGPTTDGGFYAIACRRVAREMFAGVTWSCAETLRQTLRAVRECGLSVALGPEWYDVDEGADLDRLAADPGLRDATQRVLRG